VFHEALEIGQQINEPRITNLVLSNLGVLYGYFGDYPKSLDCHYRSLRIKQELGLPLAAEMNSIAGVHFNMGDYERALQLFLECLDDYRNAGDRYGEAIALGNIGESQQALGRWEPALGYWQQALAVYQELNDMSGTAHTMQSLARYYRAAGDRDRALEIYAQARELVSDLQSKSWIVQILTNIGELYAECGRREEALELLQEALSISSEQGAREDEMECHRLISEIHEQREEGMDALRHFKQYAMIREELFGQEKRNAIAELQTRAEIESIEREREILRLKTDRLEIEMEHKAKELTSLAMQLVQKNELLDSICSQIREAEQERSQSLGVLLRQIESNRSSAREWEQFEQQFQSLHHDFIDRLAREHPSLSPTELRVCALLKINLSTKEIANILCSSVRTVEDHRYRIRTKLGLKSASNLAALIAGM
jgi:tetratricopeptide (TPR) repeat protein